MKNFVSFLAIACLLAGMVGCNKTNPSAVSDETVTTESQSGRTMDEMSIEEVEMLYLNKGSYNFNVAGYDFTFVEYLKHNPATMKYAFEELRQAEDYPLDIIDSPDGKIRAYNWCSYTGENQLSWSTLFQIEDKGKVYVIEDFPDWDTETSTIEHIYKLPHPNYYIFVYYLREWASQGYFAAVGYELKGHKLKRTSLFTDQDATHRDRLDYEYNIPDYYFRIARAVGFDYQFYYDEKTATLYYPQTRIKAEEGLLLSDRYIPYTWEGHEMMEGEKEVGNPHLNPALQDYVYVEQMVRFKSAATIIARIDVLEDGSYRYASWVNEPWSEEPSMLLYHGTADEKRYYFRNKTHTYVITKAEWPVLEVYYSSDPYELGEMYTTDQSVDYDTP